MYVIGPLETPDCNTAYVSFRLARVSLSVPQEARSMLYLNEKLNEVGPSVGLLNPLKNKESKSGEGEMT